MKLRITADGRVCGLWDDGLELPRLGPVRVRRASYIEFDNRSQQWCVRCAASGAGWRCWRGTCCPVGVAACCFGR